MTKLRGSEGRSGQSRSMMIKKRTKEKSRQCLVMPNIAKELGHEREVETVATRAANEGDKRRELLSHSQKMMVVGWIEERMGHPRNLCSLEVPSRGIVLKEFQGWNFLLKREACEDRAEAREEIPSHGQGTTKMRHQVKKSAASPKDYVESLVDTVSHRVIKELSLCDWQVRTVLSILGQEWRAEEACSSRKWRFAAKGKLLKKASNGKG